MESDTSSTSPKVTLIAKDLSMKEMSLLENHTKRVTDPVLCSCTPKRRRRYMTNTNTYSNTNIYTNTTILQFMQDMQDIQKIIM